MTYSFFKSRAFVLTIVILYSLLNIYALQSIGEAKAPVTDELYTYYQFKDKSIDELFDSLHSGVNRHPCVYFVYLWTLDQFIDMDMQACRQANLPFLVAACVIFILITIPRLNPMAALACTASIFCIPWIVPNHLCQARPETMLLAAAAAQLALFLKIQSREFPGRLLLFSNGAVSYLMPAIHYFGGIYSLFAFATLIFIDIRAGNIRWKVYFSFFSGWLIFLVTCGSTLIDQLDFGPRLATWLTKPHLDELTTFFTTIFPALPIFILVSLIALCSAKILKNRSTKTHRIVPLLSLALAWLLPPMIFWFLGRTGIYLYAAKYFYPSLLGAGLLLGCLVHLALGETKQEINPEKERATKALVVTFLAFCLVTQLYHIKRLTFSESRGNNFHRILEPGETWKDTNTTFVTSMDSLYLVNLYKADQQKKASMFHLLFDHEKERKAYIRFSPKIQTLTTAELRQIDSFVYITPLPEPEKWRKWIKQLGFNIHRSASYNQHLFHAWQLKRPSEAPNES